MKFKRNQADFVCKVLEKCCIVHPRRYGWYALLNSDRALRAALRDGDWELTLEGRE